MVVVEKQGIGIGDVIAMHRDQQAILIAAGEFGIDTQYRGGCPVCIEAGLGNGLGEGAGWRIATDRQTVGDRFEQQQEQVFGFGRRVVRIFIIDFNARQGTNGIPNFETIIVTTNSMFVRKQRIFFNINF